MTPMGWLVAALTGFVCLFVGIFIGLFLGFREGEQTDTNAFAAREAVERDAVPRWRGYIQ
jgi:ABC-type dipeptide/oligopeptide/nickel transport system permease subunit